MPPSTPSNAATDGSGITATVYIFNEPAFSCTVNPPSGCVDKNRLNTQADGASGLPSARDTVHMNSMPALSLIHI